ncbi:MAG: carbon-nitrogen hydrolase family protein [Alphaproteobacteria bacterium]|nr:carbon-nitrogen hydrolase family protein [Alphaproteobacteria bacterium]
MKRAALALAFVFAGLVIAQFAFRNWPVKQPAPSAGDIALRELGAPAGADLIGVEPHLTAHDYASAAALRDKLRFYLTAAETRGWLTDRSVVVFPEHIGTWLVAADAPAAVYAARTTDGAMAALALGDPVDFARDLLRSRERDRAAAAIFRMRSKAMARDYNEVFGALAREFRVTVVAGSIVLEAPGVANGRVYAGEGPLYGVSAVFGPDGRAAPNLVFKANPIPSESGFSAPGEEPPAAFETPAGRLGVLICADSWDPGLYRALKEENIDILAVPAFLQPDGVWLKPWRGYVTTQPEDVDAADEGRISERDAWLKYAMAGRLAASGARTGLTVFLRGDLWSLGADGHAIARRDGETTVFDDGDGGAVVALWLTDRAAP